MWCRAAADKSKLMISSLLAQEIFSRDGRGDIYLFTKIARGFSYFKG